MAKGLKGTVTHVDDAGQIHMKWENGSSLALNVGVDTFKKVEPEEKISVVLVEPGKYPKVDGYIEEYMPFDDEVAIVCNEEGKVNGLPLNRAVYGENKEILDVIAGKFFIAYAPIESEKFQSMPKDLARKYLKKFKYPERFNQTENGIAAKAYKPVSKDMER